MTDTFTNASRALFDKQVFAHVATHFEELVRAAGLPIQERR